MWKSGLPVLGGPLFLFGLWLWKVGPDCSILKTNAV